MEILLKYADYYLYCLRNACVWWHALTYYTLTRAASQPAAPISAADNLPYGFAMQIMRYCSIMRARRRLH
jgi:hypothetical protein